MTLNSDGVMIEFECDGFHKHPCGNTEGYELDELFNFQAAVADLRSRGWRFFPIAKTDREWSHRCPDCVKAFNEEARKKLLA